MSAAQLRQLAIIAGPAPQPGEYFEFRRIAPGRGVTGREFIPADRPGRAAALIAKWRDQPGDLFAAMALRVGRNGGKSAVPRMSCVYLDLDTDEAVERIGSLHVVPGLVVRSGSGQNLHVVIPLAESVGVKEGEAALKRLAAHFGGDPQSAEAARLLRVVDTYNTKSGQRVPVTCEVYNEPAPTIAQVLHGIPELPKLEPPRPIRRQAKPTEGSYDAASDVLLTIPAEEYIPALTGRHVGPGRKVCCPFHGGGGERTPSLHVYDDGWACFGGCEPRPGRTSAGGDIITFGSLLYGIAPTGRGFHDIRRRLAGDLLHATAQTASVAA